MIFTNLIRYAAGSFFGAVGFAMLARIPRRAWVPSGAVAVLVYLVYWLLPLTGISEYIAVFCASLLGSVLGHLCARRMKMIHTMYLMSAVVPVVPGLGLYRTMAFLGQGQLSPGAREGLQAMIIIAMTALGLVIGSFLDRLFHEKKKS